MIKIIMTDNFNLSSFRVAVSSIFFKGVLIYLFILGVAGVFSVEVVCCAEDKPVPVIETKSWQLSDRELVQILNALPPEKRQTLRSNPQRLNTFVRRIAQTRTVASIAREDGFTERPDVKLELSRVMDDILTQMYINNMVISRIKISDEAAELYYKAHRDEFKTDPQAHFKQIVIKVPSSASSAEVSEIGKRAQAIARELKEGGDFDLAVKKYTDDPAGRNSGGDVGWIAKSKLDPDFAKMVFSLQPGEIGGPLRTKKGLHIIKLEGLKPGKQLSYNQVKGLITKKLYKEKKARVVKKFIDKALEDADIRINVERIMEISQDIPAG